MSDTRKNRTVGPPATFPGGVLQTKLERVGVENFADLVDNRLGCERAIGGARGAVGRGLWLIHDDVVPVDDHVGNVVRRKNTAGSGTYG